MKKTKSGSVPVSGPAECKTWWGKRGTRNPNLLTNFAECFDERTQRKALSIHQAAGEQRGPCAGHNPQHHDPSAGWHRDSAAAAHRTTFVPQQTWLRRNFLLVCEFSVWQTTEPWNWTHAFIRHFILISFPDQSNSRRKESICVLQSNTVDAGIAVLTLNTMQDISIGTPSALLTVNIIYKWV